MGSAKGTGSIVEAVRLRCVIMRGSPPALLTTLNCIAAALIATISGESVIDSIPLQVELSTADNLILAL